PTDAEALRRLRVGEPAHARPGHAPTTRPDDGGERLPAHPAVVAHGRGRALSAGPLAGPFGGGAAGRRRRPAHAGTESGRNCGTRHNRLGARAQSRLTLYGVERADHRHEGTSTSLRARVLTGHIRCSGVRVLPPAAPSALDRTF